MRQTRAGTKRMVVAFGDDSDLTEPETSDEEQEDELEEDEPTPQPAPATTSGRQSQNKKQGGQGTPAGPSRLTRPSTQRATRASRTAKQATVTTYMPRGSRTDLSLDSLYNAWRFGSIDLNPDYQRDVVWPDHKQISLLESIRHNFHVPTLIFAMTPQRDGEIMPQRVCIDGKQRLTSIIRTGKRVQRVWFTDSPHRKSGKVMSEMEQAHFKMNTFNVQDYIGLTPEQEREVFHRVQLGVALTPAERLQAINGLRADVIRAFRRGLGITTVFRNFSDWGGNRGKDYLALSQIAYLISIPPGQAAPEPNVQRIETWLRENATKGSLQQMEIGLKAAFDIFCRIVHHDIFGGAVTKVHMTPWELVLSICLIHHYKKRMNDCETSDAIDQLRKFLRARHKDLKGAKVFKDGYDFVKKTLPKTKVKSDGSKVLSADMPPLDPSLLEDESDGEGDPPVPAPPATPSKGKKRARSEPKNDGMDFDDTEIQHQSDKNDEKVAESSKPVKRRRVATSKAVVAEDDNNEASNSAAPVVKEAVTNSRPKRVRKRNPPTVSAPQASTRAKRSTAAASTSKAAIKPPIPAVAASMSSLPVMQSATSASHPSLKPKSPAASPSKAAAPLNAKKDPPLTISLPPVPPPPPPANSIRYTPERQLSATGPPTNGTGAKVPLPPTVPNPKSIPHREVSGAGARGPTTGDRLAALRSLSPLTVSSVSPNASPSNSEFPPTPIHKLPTPPAQDHRPSSLSQSHPIPPSVPSPSIPAASSAAGPSVLHNSTISATSAANAASTSCSGPSHAAKAPLRSLKFSKTTPSHGVPGLMPDTTLKPASFGSPSAVPPRLNSTAKRAPSASQFSPPGLGNYNPQPLDFGEQRSPQRLGGQGNGLQRRAPEPFIGVAGPTPALNQQQPGDPRPRPPSQYRPPN
ncbi:hypothetical protein FA15DRAFT_669575 [Coprinopsis marcescibilis]|uniref:GmrSD restriction endonucleases N-terminal domain-containing protein n=1 Tax=Coprinopsis marcescibilis TaxID=230819 RepID=A0A5C3KUZ5_COPMA|nr:hypothetical protein FA15DRAFT_669575 [Coprinopsis marcescibilis]